MPLKTSELYFELLRDWCDGMLSLQIPENGRPSLSGGLVCPACRRIHGRSADAILPMMYMAKHTGDAKYLRSARALFRWSDSLYREDGSYVNDIDNGWTGITVFFSSQLGESLLWFSDLLTETERQQWRTRFFHTARYVYEKIDKIGGTINYPAAGAHNMALAGVLSEGEERKRFFFRARELARIVCGHILNNGLIYGEAHPLDALTKKHHRGIDLGYNLEETIPALLEYAHLTHDLETEENAMKALKTHLEFFLPDGGLDNSFGSRAYKWSYWGSRTSDGIQAAAALVGRKCPEFARIARKNAELLRSSTRDGLLYGGPMYAQAGEEACVHHTFCHAKALAKALMYDPVENPEEEPQIPEQGTKYYPELGTYLIRKGAWRATLTDYDYEYCPGAHATGGALTLLRHDLAGILVAGTMNRYYVVEANNMQILPGGEDSCLTPRIEYKDGGTLYRTISDLSADFRKLEKENTFLAMGTLRSENQTGDETYQLWYEFREEELHITAEASTEAEFVFPVIAGKDEQVTYSAGNSVVIRKEKADVVICTDGEMKPQEETLRIFNPVGGFLAHPIRMPIKANQSMTVQLSVTARQLNFGLETEAEL